MKESMKDLESRRDFLFRKLASVGDFRRGTIAVNYRKCGKKNCVCAQEGHPGHGPQYLWSTTIKGKSYTRRVKLGSEMSKYMRETKNYRVSLKVFDEILQVNEKICDLRPLSEVKDDKELVELKKKQQNTFRMKSGRKLSIS